MKKLLRLALAFVALLLLSLPAMAQMFGPALVTANVNLRNGAGTRHAVIRVLRINEEVMVSHCASNWAWSMPGATAAGFRKPISAA